MDIADYRKAPAFARHVMVAAWFVMNPAPSIPEVSVAKRAAYVRRRGPAVREMLLPLFESGEDVSVESIRQRMPNVNGETVRTALRRATDMNWLTRVEVGVYRRGPRFPK